MNRMVKAIREIANWTEVAPRWFMLSVISVQFTAIGAIGAQNYYLRVDIDRLREEAVKKLQQEIEDDKINRLAILEADRKHVWDALEFHARAIEEMRKGRR